MHLAFFNPPADDEQSQRSAPAGVLAHLDAVYGLALALTGAAETAAQLTENVYLGVQEDLWATLGGHGLRERLLARTVSVYTETVGPVARSVSMSRTGVRPPDSDLDAALSELDWDERASVALVDRLGLSYTAASAVLGVGLAEFRTLLHRARSCLFAAYRAGAR